MTLFPVNVRCVGEIFLLIVVENLFSTWQVSKVTFPGHLNVANQKEKFSDPEEKIGPNICFIWS